MRIKRNIVVALDSLKLLPHLPDQSVDVIVTDPPYAITQNAWDVEFDLDHWWKHAIRICRGAIVVTAGQPFSSRLTMSGLRWFKHEWIWVKNAGSNFVNTVREPFKEHEQVLVFASSKWVYNPQMQERAASGLSRVKTAVKFETGSTNYRDFDRVIVKQAPELRVPSSVQKFNRERGLHPTQKPLALMRYLVRTYSDPGALVFDPFMGSGTTCVAAKIEGRSYLGVDWHMGYVETAQERLDAVPTTLW